jgi:hypothetical protein
MILDILLALVFTADSNLFLQSYLHYTESEIFITISVHMMVQVSLTAQLLNFVCCFAPWQLFNATVNHYMVVNNKNSNHLCNHCCFTAWQLFNVSNKNTTVTCNRKYVWCHRFLILELEFSCKYKSFTFCFLQCTNFHVPVMQWKNKCVIEDWPVQA